MTKPKSKEEIRQERLDLLWEAMAEGEARVGTTLTIRQIARFAGRTPVENNLSAVLADLHALVEQKRVECLDVETRRYKVVRDAEDEEGE